MTEPVLGADTAFGGIPLIHLRELDPRLRTDWRVRGTVRVMGRRRTENLRLIQESAERVYGFTDRWSLFERHSVPRQKMVGSWAAIWRVQVAVLTGGALDDLIGVMYRDLREGQLGRGGLHPAQVEWLFALIREAEHKRADEMTAYFKARNPLPSPEEMAELFARVDAALAGADAGKGDR